MRSQIQLLDGTSDNVLRLSDTPDTHSPFWSGLMASHPVKRNSLEKVPCDFVVSEFGCPSAHQSEMKACTPVPTPQGGRGICFFCSSPQKQIPRRSPGATASE